MNLLTVLYVVLVLAGIAWVVYRLSTYISEQRDRESRWTEMASEDEFRSYLKDLRKTPAPNNHGSKQSSAEGNPGPPLAPHSAQRHDEVAKQSK